MNPVFLAPKQFGFFKPCHCGLDASIISRAVALEILLFLLLDDLAGRGHNLAVLASLAVETSQGLQNCRDFMAGQTRPGTQIELAINIFRAEKESALRRVAITPCPPGFLQIVLQRPGNVPVNNKPNVRLVYAHAERIGRRDDTKLANSESLLDIALLLRSQSCVVAFSSEPLLLEELGNSFRGAARCAIDHCAGCAGSGQIFFNAVKDVGHFRGALRRKNFEAQVRTRSAPIQQCELQPQPLVEMSSDILNDIRLCRRCEA